MFSKKFAASDSCVWNYVAAEVLGLIFGFLDLESLKQVSLVSRRWFEISSENVRKKAAIHCYCQETVDEPHLRYYTNVKITSVRHNDVVDVIRFLHPVEVKIESLELGNMDMPTDFFMGILGMCGRLTTLILNDVTFLEPERPLESPAIHLKRLSLADADFLWATVTGLKALELISASANDEQLEQLAQSSPSIKQLTLKDSSELHEIPLCDAIDSLLDLTEMRVINCRNVARAFPHIKEAKKLKKVIFDSRMNAEDFTAAFTAPMPNLRYISIDFFNIVILNQDVVTHALSFLPNLTYFDLRRCCVQWSKKKRAENAMQSVRHA